MTVETTATVAQSDGFKKMVDAIFSSTMAKSESLIKEAEKKAIAILDESERFSLSHSEEVLSTYRQMAEIESRKELSKAEIDVRMSLLKLKESYMDSVLDGAKSMLKSATETPRYTSLMLEGLASISKNVKVAQVLMNDRDINKLGLDNIKKAVGSGVEVVAHPVGIGGFIIVVKGGKASIDRTIDSILDSERQALRAKIAETLFG